MAGCLECGFPLAVPGGESQLSWVYDESHWTTASARISEAAAAVADILRTTDDAACRRRPSPALWSRLEYAAHIRDVLLVQRERVLRGRRGHGAEQQAMGRDERVEHDGYNDQDPADVAIQVEQAALLFTNLLARLREEEWAIEIAYSFPQPMPRSLRWVAVHTAHEAMHHLHDMTSQA